MIHFFFKAFQECFHIDKQNKNSELLLLISAMTKLKDMFGVVSTLCGDVNAFNSSIMYVPTAPTMNFVPFGYVLEKYLMLSF